MSETVSTQHTIQSPSQSPGQSPSQPLSQNLTADIGTLATGWLVYIIRASDGSLYTGITNDMQRRWQQHCNGQGAKFFRGRSPEALVFIESATDRAAASRREAAIKQLTRADKLKMVESFAKKNRQHEADGQG